MVLSAPIGVALHRAAAASRMIVQAKQLAVIRRDASLKGATTLTCPAGRGAGGQPSKQSGYCYYSNNRITQNHGHRDSEFLSLWPLGLKENIALDMISLSTHSVSNLKIGCAFHNCYIFL